LDILYCLWSDYHSWEFYVNNTRNLIEFFESKLSRKKKIITNGKVWEGKDDSEYFCKQLEFLDSMPCRIDQKGENHFELTIDNQTFTHLLYLEKKQKAFL